MANKYWVGDGGNWNDPDHWSLISGGAGGAVIPTAYDDAIINENSFTRDGQIVLLSDACYCKTFNCSTINYSVEFNFIDFAFLNIFGDITLSSNVSFSYPVLTNNDIINQKFTFGIKIYDECNILSSGIKMPPIKQYVYIENEGGDDGGDV